MVRLLFPILILEAYCLYDAYKKQADQKWFIVILLFPLLGSLVYLFASAAGKTRAIGSKALAKSGPLSNSKIKHLESELAFTDTVRNRMLLAHEYTSIGEFNKAKTLYESCLSGAANDDLSLLIRLVDVSFESGDYKSAINHGERINGRSLFDKSIEKTAYAWSLYKVGQIDEAEDAFKQMDARYTNYVQRLEFAKFYSVTDRDRAAKEVLSVLINELDSMHRDEQQLKKGIIKEIKTFYKNLP